MAQSSTSLELFLKQKETESHILTEKGLRLINDDNFNINSLSKKEKLELSKLIKKLFIDST